MQVSQQGRQWRERKCPLFETVAKRDSNPGSLDYESGVLPLSYRDPRRAGTQRDKQREGKHNTYSGEISGEIHGWQSTH